MPPLDPELGENVVISWIYPEFIDCPGNAGPLEKRLQ